jgi:hypothetical protein
MISLSSIHPQRNNNNNNNNTKSKKQCGILLLLLHIVSMNVAAATTTVQSISLRGLQQDALDLVDAEEGFSLTGHDNNLNADDASTVDLETTGTLVDPVQAPSSSLSTGPGQSFVNAKSERCRLDGQQTVCTYKDWDTINNNKNHCTMSSINCTHAFYNSQLYFPAF